MNNVYIHPNALVESDQIGEGSRVWAMAHVMRGAIIGTSCNIGDHCFIERGAVVGNNVTIKNGNMIWHGVTLEDGVFVGPHVFFTNDTYPRSPRHPAVNQRHRNESADWLAATRVCEGASLGAGAVLLAPLTIGAFAMVGGGAVVTRDVAPHALVVGNPAQQRGWVCFCGLPLRFGISNRARCACGCQFEQQTDSIVYVDERASAPVI